MKPNSKRNIILDTRACQHYYRQPETAVANLITLLVIHSLEFRRALKKIVNKNNSNSNSNSNSNNYSCRCGLVV